MSKYRINVRFDLDKSKEANAAQYLQSLDKSRNAFMVTAVLNEMQRQTSTNGVLLEDIRQVIREELQEVSFVAAPPVFEQVQPELTEEQQAENEKSVLDDLEMFGCAKMPRCGSNRSVLSRSRAILAREQDIPSMGKNAVFSIRQPLFFMPCGVRLTV